MKLGILACVGMLFALVGCASMQDTYDDSITLEAEYGEVWQAAVMALSETGFSVQNSDRDSGLLYARGGKNAFLHNEAPQLNVIIQGLEAGGTRVTARAVQAGQIYDYGSGRKNAERFFEALRELL